MIKIQADMIDPYETASTCAWCNKKISEGSEIFSLGVKVKAGVDLQGMSGRAIRLLLPESGKIITAIVPAHDSMAKKDGNDLLFAVCSQECGKALKLALQEDLDVFGQIQFPLLG
ncbi:MAG: hypothetical protein WAN58_04560 [Anaerolineales bacterium]